MRILPSGRFFFVAQWIMPWPVAVVLVLGANVLSALGGSRREAGPITDDPGYAILAALFRFAAAVLLWGPPIVVVAVVLLLPALATLADREVRATRRVRWGSAVAGTVLWVVAPVAAIGVPEIGRAAQLDRVSFGPLWPSHRVDELIVLALGLVACAVVALAWATEIVFAAVGAALGERRGTLEGVRPRRTA